MPKAAVDKDGELFADVGDVRADGRERTTPSARRVHPSLVRRGARDADAAMEAVAAEAGFVEGFAEGELGCGVFGAVRTHDARDRFVLWRG